MTPEDEAFNEIERQAKQRKEAVLQAITEAEKQEPVGWIDSKGNMICTKINESCKPLYTHPQPEQDEVDIRSRLYQRIHELEELLRDFAKAIEAKLKEKNT